MGQKTASSIGEAIQTLRLFNDKAEKLHRCSFIQKVFRKDHSVTIKFGMDQPIEVEKVGSDEEATAALALTLRFFLQQRDGIRYDQIRDLYDVMPVPEEDKQNVRRWGDDLKAFLDEPTELVLHGETPSNERFLEIFMYGDLSHANDDKRQLFSQWMNTPMDPLMDFYFEDIVAGVVQFIFGLYKLNQDTIERLKTFSADALLPLPPRPSPTSTSSR
jgi:hypothetical protein